MNMNYHNKITITTSNNSYEFYNNMLPSVFQKIANLQSFCDKIAFGTGENQFFSSEYHLSEYKFCCNLIEHTYNYNPVSSELFVEKIATINTDQFEEFYITEAGITSNDENYLDPIIYNFFSFISEDTPNGIKIDKNDNDTITISVKIFLTLQNSTIGLLTKGNNPLISFLLGGGINNQQIYVARGNNLTDNILIERPNTYVGEKYICTCTATVENGLSLLFEGDLENGKTDEIIFFIGDIIFARMNTSSISTTYTRTELFLPKQNYVIDLGSGVSQISSVSNQTTSENETNIYYSKYASDLASKISLPFNNMFNSNTQRFVSREGDKIFFVLNDYVYIYENNNYQVLQLTTNNASIRNVYKICAMGDYLFIFTKGGEYVFYSFVMIYGNYYAASMNMEAFNDYSLIHNYIDVDVVLTKDDTIMMGYYVQSGSTKTAYTVYLKYNPNIGGYVYNKHLATTGYNYSYLVAMSSNKYCDAQIFYFQTGQYSYDCARIIHKADGTVNNVYSSLTYTFLNQTKSIVCKSRAILIEKYTSPFFWVYYYPQIYQFTLPIFDEGISNYISSNLLYLFKKYEDGSAKMFNLVGYDTVQEFVSGIPTEIDQSKILSIEILKDVVLFFMDDINEPIIAYSLKDTSMCIENVNSNEDTYAVNLTRTNYLGENREGVIAKFAVDVTI